VLIQVLYRLFKRGDYAVLLIVRGEDDAEEELGGFNGADVGSWVGFVWAKALLAEVSFCEPSIVPAGERARGRLSGSAARDVCLFRGEDGARFRGDEVEEDEELRGWLVLACGLSQLHQLNGIEREILH
jgi:hypothetical protein